MCMVLMLRELHTVHSITLVQMYQYGAELGLILKADEIKMRYVPDTVTPDDARPTRWTPYELWILVTSAVSEMETFLYDRHRCGVRGIDPQQTVT